MSPKSTSALSPGETKWEKPMPLDFAKLSIAVVSPPDWEPKASLPTAAEVWAKLALRPMPGMMSPTQLGPRTRNRCGRAGLEHGLP